MSKIKRIKGVADLFSPQSDVFNFMENTARDVFSKYGVRELRTPIMESTDLFVRSIGGETDVVQKEMYTFADRKGRSLTLRPEATAGVVRAYIDSKLYTREGVSKLFTTGPMFRYERPQKGRQRQFHQINVEVFGARSAQADAELLLMLWTFLQKLGLEKLQVEINSLGCPQCRPGYHAMLEKFLASIPKENFCTDCQRRAKTNPLRVLDCKVPGCKEIAAKAPRLDQNLCSECKEHFKDVLEIVDSAKVNYVQNPMLVRGLDYYQRTTFEVVSGDIGAQTAVAGGGRYDGLVKELGGPDLPGAGFACGMERLAMLIGDLEAKPLDFYLAVLDEKALNTGLVLSQKLRDSGYSGEVSFETKSLKSQLRQANKIGAKTCLVLGESEMEKGLIQVKDMATGVQREVGQCDLDQALGLQFN